MLRTHEEREAWVAAQRAREDMAREALIAGVAGLSQRQGWVQWLELVGRLPHYSLSNQLLLAHQLPTASMVMSADQWRKVGRWPAKGSVALRIWAPRRGRGGRSDQTNVDDDQEQRPPGQQPGEQRLDARRRFLLVPVFDVSQTEGTPLPTQPDPVPPPPGQAPAGMWKAMVSYAAAAGFTVTMGDTGAADGMTNFATSTITIAERGSELAQTLTLAHELGHMSLHGTPDAHGGHRGRGEVQAESVAYLVANQYGLAEATEWHFDYLAHWAARVPGDAEAVMSHELRDTASGVLAAARPLLEHLAEACVGHPDPLVGAAAPAPPIVVEVTR